MNFIFPTKITSQTGPFYALSFFLGITIFFILFIASYTFKLPVSQAAYILLISILDAVIMWFLLKGFGVIPRVVVIAPAIFFGFIISFLYIEIAHEYAMWDICYPKIKEASGIKNNWELPDKGAPSNSSNLYQKMWYQHLECEDNILPFPWGKQAKFSDNPPGFLPKEATSESNPK